MRGEGMNSVIRKVRKRDGGVQDFTPDRIGEAIRKAAEAQGLLDFGSEARRLQELVVRRLEEKGYGEERLPDVEVIQDEVEAVLREEGYGTLSEGYHEYRKRHDELRRSRSTIFDVGRMVEEFIGGRDWRSRENANLRPSISSMMFNSAGAINARYLLDKVYPPEVADSHVDGDLHLHDLYQGVAGYCFDEQTRILTKEGFKYFKDVTCEDEVATLNLETGELEFQRPIAKQVFDYDGVMYWWNNKRMDLLVTPEHRMLVRPVFPYSYRKFNGERLEKYWRAMELRRKYGWGSLRIARAIGAPEGTVNEWIYHNRKPRVHDPDGRWRIVRAHELAKRNRKWPVEFKKGAKWRGRDDLHLPETESQNWWSIKNVDPPIEDFVRFLGWYISEGNCCRSKGGYRIAISQLNKKNQKRIAEIVRRLGFKPCITEYHVSFHSKQLYEYLKKLGLARQKYIPNEIKELNPRLLTFFLEELFRGDGTVKNGKWTTYFTASKRLAEDVLECLIKVGKSGYILKGKKRTYSVSVTDRTTVQYSGAPRMVRYKGKVYDLTVPNGTLLAERNGKVVWTGNCAGHSMEDILTKGLVSVGNNPHSRPPKHLDVALMQVVNYIGVMTQEWAGAQAFSWVDAYLAPFIREDGLTYRQLKQLLQMFVYNLNVTSRWGGQSPFSNVTLACGVPEPLRDKPAVIGGRPLGRTYEEYGEEIELFDKAFLEVLLEGDAASRPFTFPIPTFAITRDFPWEDGVSSLLFEVAAKYGLPYFQNFVRSDLSPWQIYSMCCRLQIDLRELQRNVTGGLFGSSPKTGSVGVVTINLSRAGYLAKGSEDELFRRLRYLCILAERALKHKREIVERNIQAGLLPYTKEYFGDLRRHFSTVGVVGGHEMCLNMGIERGIASREGAELCWRVLEFLREECRRLQEETGHLYNLEATPAEGVSYRLARLDRRKFGKAIHTSGEREPFYTNSTQLPVDSDFDLVDALEHQEPLQTLYTGGTVFHIYLGESLEEGESCRNLMRKVTSKTRLPYFTLTPTYSICGDHGLLRGEHPSCPICGREADVYSRVVGYYRPVKNWNAGKQEEFRLRKKYS
jgi:ribonucleoside-triphosphate reductase